MLVVGHSWIGICGVVERVGEESLRNHNFQLGDPVLSVQEPEEDQWYFLRITPPVSKMAETREVSKRAKIPQKNRAFGADLPMFL